MPSVTAASASPKRVHDGQDSRSGKAAGLPLAVGGGGSSPTLGAAAQPGVDEGEALSSKWPRVYWKRGFSHLEGEARAALFAGLFDGPLRLPPRNCCGLPGAAGDHEVVEQQGEQARPQVRRQPGEVEGPGGTTSARNLGGDGEQAWRC